MKCEIILVLIIFAFIDLKEQQEIIPEASRTPGTSLTYIEMAKSRTRPLTNRSEWNAFIRRTLFNITHQTFLTEGNAFSCLMSGLSEIQNINPHYSADDSTKT